MKELGIVVGLIVAGVSSLPLCADMREVYLILNGDTEGYARIRYSDYGKQRVLQEQGKWYRSDATQSSDDVFNQPSQ